MSKKISMADLFISLCWDDRPKVDRPDETNLRPCSVPSAEKVPPILSPDEHAGYPAYTSQPGAAGTQTCMASGAPVWPRDLIEAWKRSSTFLTIATEGRGSLKI
jgi:hypothetical protein